MGDDGPVVFLRGERVYLRPLEMADLQRCQRWINDPAIRATLMNHLPMNEIAEKGFIESASKPDKEVHLAVVLNEGDQHIGTTGVFNIQWKHRCGEFGITIGEAEKQGCGYGLEATRLTVKYAFEELNLNRLELSVADFHERGIKIYEAAGFRREGVRRECMSWGGRYVDLVLYSMLASEYQGSPGGK